MIIPRIKFLDQKDRELIHGKSLQILQKAGIQFNSEKALAILEEAGCRVNRNEMSAKIPQKLVEKCLKTLPSSFAKAARDEKNNFTCGDGNIFYTSVAMPSWIRDLDTRKRRLATLDDLIQCADLV
ncbi:MAG: trimethylamine methyltransferase family protein, partial [Deltaproteobacteria bacterium]|nr:trimethylamine methyltransferase family protein [Deltaproteobacteria bacterium]